MSNPHGAPDDLTDNTAVRRIMIPTVDVGCRFSASDGVADLGISVLIVCLVYDTTLWNVYTRRLVDRYLLSQAILCAFYYALEMVWCESWLSSSMIVQTSQDVFKSPRYFAFTF